MLRHIILWKLKDTVEDKEGTKAKVKASLEALVGVVDGLEELTVHTDGLASSRRRRLSAPQSMCASALISTSEEKRRRLAPKTDLSENF